MTVNNNRKFIIQYSPDIRLASTTKNMRKVENINRKKYCLIVNSYSVEIRFDIFIYI